MQQLIKIIFNITCFHLLIDNRHIIIDNSWTSTCSNSDVGSGDIWGLGIFSDDKLIFSVSLESSSTSCIQNKTNIIIEFIENIHKT